MAGLDELDVILENLFGAAHLRLFALEFQLVAVQQARAQIQFAFEKPYIFIAGAKQRIQCHERSEQDFIKDKGNRET